MARKRSTTFVSAFEYPRRERIHSAKATDTEAMSGAFAFTCPASSWDITKLATLERGVFLHACGIIDLFSRYVVGWMVAAKECKHLAAQLFADAVARHGIEPGLRQPART